MGQLGFRTSTRIVGSVMVVFLGIAACFVRTYVHPVESPQLLVDSNSHSVVEEETSVSAGLDISLVKELTGCEYRSGIPPSISDEVHRTHQSSTAKIALDISVFKEVEYVLLLISSFFFALTYLVPSIMLPSYSVSIDLTALQGASLISASSGASVFTRIAFGYVADRIGILNTILACQFMTTLSCFALWLPAKGFTVLLIFMIVYGGCAGALFVLLPVAASKSVDLSRMASALSFVFFVYTAGGVVGPPVAECIVEANGGYFRGVIVFLGMMNVVIFVIVAVIRMRAETKFFIAV